MGIRTICECNYFTLKSKLNTCGSRIHFFTDFDVILNINGLASWFSKMTNKDKHCSLTKVSGLSPTFGAIFMSNISTLQECMKRKLFGLPSSHADFVGRVKAGMILFVFEYEKRELWGVFKAVSNGAMNICPHAYSSSGKRFPSQVRFTTIWRSRPLSENEFREAIRDNYFAQYKFNFGLSKYQVHKLLQLYSGKITAKVIPSPSSGKKEGRKRYLLDENRGVYDDSNHPRDAGKKPRLALHPVIIHPCLEPRGFSAELSLEEDDSQHFVSKGLDEESENLVPQHASEPHSSCTEYNQPPNFSETPMEPSKTDDFKVAMVSLNLLDSAGSSDDTCEKPGSFATGHESVSHSNTAVKDRPCVSVEEPINSNLSTEGSIMELGDFIPLVPDDLEPTDSATPFCELDCFPHFRPSEDLPSSEHIPLIPKLLIERSKEEYVDHHPSAASVQDRSQSSSPGLSSHEYQENGGLVNRGCSQFVKGLYSDAANNQTSVFSRLKFPSKAQEAEYETRVRMHKSKPQKGNTTTAHQSIEDIMAELQQSWDTWKRAKRTCKSPEVQEVVEKRTNVFLRLSWGNQTQQQKQRSRYI